MQARAAIGLLSGPEHRFTFVNRDYLRLTGRRKAEDFIGRTVREALPEVEGQGIFEILDGVYKTGVPYQATARQVSLNRGPEGRREEVYFDFMYQPLRDAAENLAVSWFPQAVRRAAFGGHRKGHGRAR
jgi:PAS domain-containing protein